MFASIFWLLLILLIYWLPLSLVWIFSKLKVTCSWFRQDQKWKQSWLLVLACAIVLVFFLYFQNINMTESQNFALHFFGGGVVVSLIFEYWKLNLKEQIPWPIQFLALYFVVSAFGVGNELLELIFDLLFKIPMSNDRFDTWWDLVANTSGAYTGWLVCQGVRSIIKTYKSAYNKSV